MAKPSKAELKALGKAEAQAFEAYRSHVGSGDKQGFGCAECAPGSGIVCETGRQLHDAWRQAQARLGSPPSSSRTGVGRPSRTWTIPEVTARLQQDYLAKRAAETPNPG
jgi:hypothetical protein